MRWTMLYEDNPGGKMMTRPFPGVFWICEWTDMDDACGRDNEGHDKYVVELSEVDTRVIDDRQWVEVKNSCGWDGMPDTAEARAECAHGYGLKAPLDSWSGNNLGKLKTQARKRARELKADPGAYEQQMSRPVNAIGSTAREFGQGNIHSAMLRGVSAGDDKARLMAKMYGASDTRGPQGPGFSCRADMGFVKRQGISDDPIAYTTGFVRAMAGAGLDWERKLAPAYVEGHKLGLAVRRGDAELPTWVR